MLINKIQNRSEYNEILDNVRTTVINAVQIHIKRIARYRLPLSVFLFMYAYKKLNQQLDFLDIK